VSSFRVIVFYSWLHVLIFEVLLFAIFWDLAETVHYEMTHQLIFSYLLACAYTS